MGAHRRDGVHILETLNSVYAGRESDRLVAKTNLKIRDDGTIHASVVPTPVVGMPVPCKEALALAGATVTEEPSLCNLAKMECGTIPPEHQAGYAEAMHTDDTLVALDLIKYNVSVGGARLSLLRDVIDRQHGRNEAPFHPVASPASRTASPRPL